MQAKATPHQLVTALVAGCIALVLTACGGGLSVAVPGAVQTPSITSQPVNQSVIAGQSATFSVAATGSETLIFQWKKNGTNIPGATSSSYTTPATTNADSGAVYSVVVTNSAGTATSNAASSIVTAAAVALVITTQPANQSAITGQSATFSVKASGTSLSYQWKKNGTDIPGATSSTYITPATALADNGAVFAVVVSNSAGSVTSNGAALRVNAAVILMKTETGD